MRLQGDPSTSTQVQGNSSKGRIQAQQNLIPQIPSNQTQQISQLSQPGISSPTPTTPDSNVQIRNLTTQLDLKIEALDTAFMDMSQIKLSYEELLASRETELYTLHQAELLRMENDFKRALVKESEKLGQEYSEQLKALQSLEIPPDNTNEVEDLASHSQILHLESKLQTLESTLSLTLSSLQATQRENTMLIHQNTKLTTLVDENSEMLTKTQKLETHNSGMFLQIEEMKERISQLQQDKISLLEDFENERQFLQSRIETLESSLSSPQSPTHSHSHSHNPLTDYSEISGHTKANEDLSQIEWFREENERLIRTIEYWRSLHDDRIREVAERQALSPKLLLQDPLLYPTTAATPSSADGVPLEDGAERDVDDVILQNSVLKEENNQLKLVLRNIGQTRLQSEENEDLSPTPPQDFYNNPNQPYNHQVHEKITELEQWKLETEVAMTELRSLLEKERHANELLNNEVENVLPDYIELYHRERRCVISLVIS